LSGRTSGKEKQQSPQRCPKCGATANLTVPVTVIPDGSSVLGDRVVWDNDTATKCGACGFIGKVADFEPTDSYSPENEEEMENRVAGMYGFVLKRAAQGAGFRDEIRRRWEARMAKKGEMANAEPVVAPPVISPLAPLAFREAKTMPECPHEYVVRTPENEAAMSPYLT